MKFGGLFVAMFVSFAAIASCCYVPEWSTQYATPHVKKSFHDVQVGAPLETVYEQLGKPFYSVIIYNGTNSPIEYDYNVTMEHIQLRMQDTSISLWLQYARNNGLTRWSYRYEIEMRTNKAVRINQDFQD